MDRHKNGDLVCQWQKNSPGGTCDLLPGEPSRGSDISMGGLFTQSDPPRIFICYDFFSAVTDDAVFSVTQADAA